MALAARYAIVPSSDKTVKIPTAGGINEAYYEDIQAPGVVQNASAVLTFKINPDGDSRVRIRVNATNVVDVTFGEGRQRSWHEIIPGSVLKESNNALTVALTGSGSIQISDFYILYTASI